MKRLTETYEGRNSRYRGCHIRTTYFEREYIHGVATDKLPVEKFLQPGYARRFADLLGRAAAPSLVVGRSFDYGKRLVFDDGDEVVLEGPDGLPADILLCDHSGAFGEYKLPLENGVAHYARPVNLRDRILPDAREFAEVYLAAFRERLHQIQRDYRKRRRAFDTLFKHTKYDEEGSFAYRWERVLGRLDHTNVDDLIQAIRRRIAVLTPCA
jgi:hypothetical protein